MTTDSAFAHRAHQSLWDLAEPGRSGVRLPESDVPEQPLPDASLLRDGLSLPEISELDVVRHYTRLSQKNFAIDTNFYPPRLLHNEIQPQDQ